MTIHRTITLLLVAVMVCSLSDAFHLASFVRGNQKHFVKSSTQWHGAMPSALGMATWSNGQAIKEYQGML